MNIEKLRKILSEYPAHLPVIIIETDSCQGDDVSRIIQELGSITDLYYDVERNAIMLVTGDKKPADAPIGF